MFQILSNAEKRRIYDQGGEQAIKEGGSGGGGGFHSPMDVFDMFFGGGGNIYNLFWISNLNNCLND